MVLPPSAPAASSPKRCSEGAARWALRPGRACSLLLLLTLLAPQAGRSPAAAAGQPRSTAGTTIAPPSAPPPALNHRPISSPSAVRDPAAPFPASGTPASPLPNSLPGPLAGGLPAPGASSPEPALGVWLTTVDSAVMHDPAEAQRALAFLRHNGFRRAVWIGFQLHEFGLQGKLFKQIIKASLL